MESGFGEAGIGRIYLVSEELHTVSASEIDAAERQLGSTLPGGYGEYLSALGIGTLCSLVRVWPPERIRIELKAVRERWAVSHPWDAALQSPQLLSECVMVADTVDGDELVFHEDQNRLYLLPRHAATITPVGSTLWEAIDHVLSRRKPRLRFTYFAPSDNAEKIPVEVPASVSEVAAFLATELQPDHVVEKTRSSYLCLVKAIGGQLLALENGPSATRAWISHDRQGEDRAREAALKLAELRGKPPKTTSKGLPPEMMRGRDVDWGKLLQAGVTDETLAQLGEMKHLSNVHLPACNTITASGLACLAGLKRLSKLTLAGSAVSDAGVAILGPLESLRQLDLANTAITGAAVSYLSRWTRLEFLNLSRTDVGDEGLEALVDLPKLTFLRLDGTQVGDRGILHVAGCTHLTFLDISGTGVTNAAVAALGSLPRLERLICANTGISKDGGEELTRLNPRLVLDWS